MKYIPAEKLIAEINGIIAAVEVKKHPDEFGSIEQCMAAAEIEALNLALNCVKELQQEQPEAVLTDNASFANELKRFLFDTGNEKKRGGVILPIIKHFYELGLNARKEE